MAWSAEIDVRVVSCSLVAFADDDAPTIKQIVVINHDSGNNIASGNVVRQAGNTGLSSSTSFLPISSRLHEGVCKIKFLWNFGSNFKKKYNISYALFISMTWHPFGPQNGSIITRPH